MTTGLNGRVELYYVSAGLGLVVAAQAVFAGFRPRGSRWLLVRGAGHATGLVRR
jgi:hypothetical protein